MVASAPRLIEDVFRALAAQQGPYVPLNFCPFHNSNSGSSSGSTTLGGGSIGGAPSFNSSNNSGNSSPTRTHHYYLRSSNTPAPPPPAPILYGHSYLGGGSSSGAGGSSSSSSFLSRDPGAPDGNPPRKRMRITMSSTPLASSPLASSVAPLAPFAGTLVGAGHFSSSASASAASAPGALLAAELAAEPQPQVGLQYLLGVGPSGGLRAADAALGAGAPGGGAFRSSVVDSMPLLARELENGPSSVSVMAVHQQLSEQFSDHLSQELSQEVRAHSNGSSNGSSPVSQRPSSAGNSPGPLLPGAGAAALGSQESTRSEQ